MRSPRSNPPSAPSARSGPPGPGRSGENGPNGATWADEGAARGRRLHFSSAYGLASAQHIAGLAPSPVPLGIVPGYSRGGLFFVGSARFTPLGDAPLPARPVGCHRSGPLYDDRGGPGPSIMRPAASSSLKARPLATPRYNPLNRHPKTPLFDRGEAASGTITRAALLSPVTTGAALLLVWRRRVRVGMGAWGPAEVRGGS